MDGTSSLRSSASRGFLVGVLNGISSSSTSSEPLPSPAQHTPSSTGGLSTGSSNAMGFDFNGSPSAQSGLQACDPLHRWRGVFVPALEKVLKVQHPTLNACEDALLYVENLILRLMAMLTSRPSPSSAADVEERVHKMIPEPLAKMMVREGRQAVSLGKRKSGLVFPVDRVHPIMREQLHAHSRLDEIVTLYLVAIMEYISMDILKTSGIFVKQIRNTKISCQDIKVSMCADKVLMEVLQQENDPLYPFEDAKAATAYAKKYQTYEEVVKDLIMDEKQYLKDLQMITKVFRDKFPKTYVDHADLDSIFSNANLNEITDLTVNLISSLEDTLEMTEEGKDPAIGTCFEELATAQDFDYYDHYARDILSSNARMVLGNLLPRSKVSEAFRSCGKGFEEAVKYCLPKLLLGPIYHCFNYFNYIQLLLKLTTSNDDAESLKAAASVISPLENKLKQAVQSAGPAAKRKPNDVFSFISHGRVSRQQKLQKLSQIQASIGNWGEGKDLTTCSSEFVCEGKLKVCDRKTKKWADRHVILCDEMILVLKQVYNHKRGSVSNSGNVHATEYKLQIKQSIQNQSVDILENSLEPLHFELDPKDGGKLIFVAESEEEKNSWMANLVMLNTKHMLDKFLECLLKSEEREHPLRLPSSDKYIFAEPDSDDNIVLEEKEKTSGVPLIKGATLVKLAERLTHHKYADPMFMKTFLTTYRSFSTPTELLDLLIVRFNIPDPEPEQAFSSSGMSSDGMNNSTSNHLNSDSSRASSSLTLASSVSSSTLLSSGGGGSSEKSSNIRHTQDRKRFKEYSQIVQFRVLNVLKHWVDQHFYDFQQDADLLEKLQVFLGKISGKSMKKWVECINKIVDRRSKNELKDKDIIFDFDRSPPRTEIHLEQDSPDKAWPAILVYHPIEIARQLTLLEFQYYRAVKPSELVDQAWTKEDKDKRSPNLLRMVRHTTNFTRYLEKLIVESENFEERAAVLHRMLEIMLVLQEYNNFNGVLAITSAIESAAVHRLCYTKENVPKDLIKKMPKDLIKALEDATSYHREHFKMYWEKLRSINPPCVPFFGQYQTNILFLEEGNPDFLSINSNLINFTKRRKVAEIISEIQQYQNQPYCLEVYDELKQLLEGLDPFATRDEREVNEYLWQKCLEIEPRNEEPIQKKRQWKTLNLRSPGIKPRMPGKNNPPNPLPRIRQPGRVMDNNRDDHHSDSPATSPVFQSPQSGQSTPMLLPTSASSSHGGESDPIKFPVMLPTVEGRGPLPSPHSPAPPIVVGNCKPPPLPPKPPRVPPSSNHHLSYHLPHHGHHHVLPLSPSHVQPRPPPNLPLRSSSQSPPPLPPRRDQGGSVSDWRSHALLPPTPPPSATLSSSSNCQPSPHHHGHSHHHHHHHGQQHSHHQHQNSSAAAAALSPARKQ